MLQIIHRVLRQPFLTIALIVILAYGLTLGMYFWNDDNAVIFKLQNLEEGAGNLGSGIFGSGSPYRMVIFSLVPIYFLFGINSYAFFAYGILFYFFAAVIVYFFAKSFLKNSRLSFIASLIFSSGLVGAESLWRVYNSVHTSIAIIYTLLYCTAYNYFISQKKYYKKIGFYLAALTFFILAIQWGFVRAHGIIIIVIAQEILFNFNIKYSTLRLAPFLYFAYIWYFAGSANTKHLGLLTSRIFEDFEFELLLVPLKTLKNIIIPDIFNFPLVIFLILLTLLIFKYRSRILFFSLIFMISGYLTYYMIYHDAVLNTTHRYLVTSLPGLSLFIVYIFSKIFKSERQIYIASGLVILLNLILINWIQIDILKNRSNPTKNFYNSLKKEIPDLEKNSVIYIDVKKETLSLNLFESFFGVGSMPNSTAIAIHYNLDRYDIILPQTFDELTRVVTEKNIEKKNIYSFFYSREQGLRNTTDQLRNALWEGENKRFNIRHPENINYQFSSPLQISLAVKPIPVIEQKFQEDIKDLTSYLNYFESRKKYYNLVSITSDTHWQSYSIDKLFDRDYSTAWMGSRGTWHNNHRETIVVDLGSPIRVGAAKMRFGVMDKTPTKYSYFCSLDGSNYQNWKTIFYRPKQHSETKIDLLDTKDCRYIKIVLEDTQGGDSPEIAEIEIIEDSFKNLNNNLAQKYEENLSIMLSSPYGDIISNYFSENGLKIEVCFITDEFDYLNTQAKSENCKNKSVRIGVNNNLELVAPQSGTVLKEIRVLPQPNLKFELSDLYGRQLKLGELIEK